jgi:hypothetical protein
MEMMAWDLPLNKLQLAGVLTPDDLRLVVTEVGG